ncbi:BQ5605_C020g09098 [Microbotryum silenes-dioicae]|uniref:BQ5605_C020g09098 protein n=1 Tax=Microbotryum silenes-dioicae TaxID=796604 RepID=A0A2X0MM63_9BASI|nr:BQ5605_C020g09098 [Microbotryum silenes-dioicae]
MRDVARSISTCKFRVRPVPDRDRRPGKVLRLLHRHLAHALAQSKAGIWLDRASSSSLLVLLRLPPASSSDPDHEKAAIMGLASALVMGVVANQLKPMLQQQLSGGSKPSQNQQYQQQHPQQQQQQQQQQQYPQPPQQQGQPQYYGAAAAGTGAAYGAQQAYQSQQQYQSQCGPPKNAYNDQDPSQYGNTGPLNVMPENHGGYHPDYVHQQSPPPPQYNAPPQQHYGGQQYGVMPFPGAGGGMPMPGGSMPMPGQGGQMPMPGQGNGGFQDGSRGDHHYGTFAAGALGVAALGAGAYAYQQHQHSQQAGGPIDYNRVLQVLQRGVQDQNLYAFYPQGSLEPLAQRIVQSSALSQIASAWNVPPETVIELARLALFDIVLYVDDSGSMRFEENGERITDLQLIVKRVTSAACLLDTDGLQIRFMHSQGQQVNSEQAAVDLIDRTKFNGNTPLATELQRQILGPLVVEPARRGTLRKPVLVVILTDGEPSEPRDTLVRVLKSTDSDLRQTRYSSDAVSYQLAQIGNDEKAYRFLNEVDQGEVGKLIDVTSNYERESANCRSANPPYTLTPDGWCLKLLLGGIDSTFDARDEGRKSGW